MSASEVHDLCGRRHSTPELVLKCEARLEARAADIKRREYNAARVPCQDKIRDWMYRTGSVDKTVAEMKREYPPPPAHLLRSRDGWWSGNVIEVYAAFLWPSLGLEERPYFRWTPLPEENGWWDDPTAEAA